MKYEIGMQLEWYVKDTGFRCLAEIISPTDERMAKKFITPEDICVYFPHQKWSTTYDQDVVDDCATIITNPETHLDEKKAQFKELLDNLIDRVEEIDFYVLRQINNLIENWLIDLYKRGKISQDLVDDILHKE
jgi:hypothetical protein